MVLFDADQAVSRRPHRLVEGGRALSFSRSEAAVELVRSADLDDLRAEAHRLHRKERRHLVYALLGFSPGFVIPLIGALLGESALMIVALFLAIPVVEGWRWARTARKARDLERSIEELLAEGEATATDGRTT